MSAETITRPVWRFYHPRFEAKAAAHVRAGGHAVLRETHRWTLLLPCDDGAIGELSAWALMDLELGDFDVCEAGAREGLAAVELPEDRWEMVAHWCERDSVHPRSVTDETLDCQACAMCCRDNDVLLDEEDLAAWRAAGRAELAGDAYTRVEGERVKLRVLASGDCVHLAGNDCGIYALRPSNCRAFPAGSECCLSAREEGRATSG